MSYCAFLGGCIRYVFRRCVIARKGSSKKWRKELYMCKLIATFVTTMTARVVAWYAKRNLSV